MANSGLIGAVLYAKDLQRLVKFYSAVADLELRTMREGYAVLGRKAPELVIVRAPKRIADTMQIESPPARREDTPIKLVFAVVDLSAARQRAAERGGVVDPTGREWEFDGAKVCDGHDPEGNVFQLRHVS
jgi:predicted enzyme related to lactoylglutathione lyase